MSCRLVSALSCGLLAFAATAYAVTGDPLPGIDVSMEQNPGGIIIAQGSTNSNGLLAAELKPGSYRAVAKISGVPIASPPKAVAIVLTVKSRGLPDNVIRVDGTWKNDAVMGIEFKTTALSTVTVQLNEGNPVQTPPSAAPFCTWASATYSQGAVFCMGPDTAIECVKPPEWVAKKNDACGKAVPVVPR